MRLHAVLGLDPGDGLSGSRALPPPLLTALGPGGSAIRSMETTTAGVLARGRADGGRATELHRDHRHRGPYSQAGGCPPGRPGALRVGSTATLDEAPPPTALAACSPSTRRQRPGAWAPARPRRRRPPQGLRGRASARGRAGPTPTPIARAVPSALWGPGFVSCPAYDALVPGWGSTASGWDRGHRPRALPAGASSPSPSATRGARPTRTTAGPRASPGGRAQRRNRQGRGRGAGEDGAPRGRYQAIAQVEVCPGHNGSVDVGLGDGPGMGQGTRLGPTGPMHELPVVRDESAASAGNPPATRPHGILIAYRCGIVAFGARLGDTVLIARPAGASTPGRGA